MDNQDNQDNRDNQDNQDNNINININNEKRQVGIVKWFSNKLGYGFITYSDENDVSHDVFVHHTSIKPRRTSYRTLTMGEYVEFSLAELKNNDQKQAINITGPAGGPLLSDSVNEFRTNYRNTRPQYNNNSYNNRPNYNTQTEQVNDEFPVSHPEQVDDQKEVNLGIIPIKKSSIIASGHSSGNNFGWSHVVRKARQQDADNKKI